MPKQFVALTTARTLLQETVERLMPLVPPERTVVVVSERYEEIALAQLALYPGVEVVRQPDDRGTGPGVMLGLAHVRARDPEAEVAIFPSDHHFDRPLALVNAVRRARGVARQAAAGLAVLAVPAERPAGDLGWVVPGPHLGRDGAQVLEFVEKPLPERALRLLEAGGLWNTMVMVTSVPALWRLCQRHLPSQARAFDRYARVVGRPRGYRMLSMLYDRMRPADFSRDLMQATRGLGVVTMVDSGWFDCGTPARLVAWLTSTDDPSGILGRLRRAPAPRSPGAEDDWGLYSPGLVASA